jgi:hypothetical protein
MNTQTDRQLHALQPPPSAEPGNNPIYKPNFLTETKERTSPINTNATAEPTEIPHEGIVPKTPTNSPPKKILTTTALEQQAVK